MSEKPTSFIVKDCTISTIATGISAGSLIDMKEKIAAAPLECLYYHFWMTRLRPYFVHSGYHNDFAVWVHRVLNETALAEKLSVLDPLRFQSLDDLRNSIIELFDQALESKEVVAWTSKKDFFHFTSSKIIIMRTARRIERPEDLITAFDQLSTSSIFYHFIDSRRHLHTNEDDFSMWLRGFGEQYDSLVNQFASIDVYFLTLPEIKRRLSTITHDFFGGGHGLS